MKSYEPPITVPETFSATGTQALPDKWWTAFDDPVLNELIEHALADNLSLRQTWATLNQSRAALRKADASFLPSLDADAGVSGKVQRSRASATSDKTWQISKTPEFDLGLSSSYEIDLWGRVAATSNAAELDVLASEEDLRAAALTLSASVAKGWYQLVENYGQIDLLQEQLDINRQVLELTELRFRQGQVAATDVIQQRQQIESVLGDLEQAESDAAVSRHALAILLGQAPGKPDIPRINDLAALPALPSVGVPADLVKRRPDLRKAYADILASDRRVAAAIADRYPVLSLTAGLSTTAKNAKDLFDNWLASLAAGLAAPLFDAGYRKAEVERTRAVVEQYLAAYGQATLTAFGEVEDALVQESRQQSYLNSLYRQIDLSDQVIERMRDRYIGGATEYINVLDTLSTNHSLERTALTAERQLLDYRIDLCVALGGGWSMTPPAALVKNDEDTETE